MGAGGSVAPVSKGRVAQRLRGAIQGAVVAGVEVDVTEALPGAACAVAEAEEFSPAEVLARPGEVPEVVEGGVPHVERGPRLSLRDSGNKQNREDGQPPHKAPPGLKVGSSVYAGSVG